MFAVILIFWELTAISFPVSIREGDFPFSTYGGSVHLYKMNLPRVGPREWNLSIATTPETFKLPWDWDMLSICLLETIGVLKKAGPFSDDREGVRKLRWKDDVNPIRSKMQGPQMILWYTYSVLHSPFTVPRNGWEKRRRTKRSQHSTRQLRASSYVSRRFNPTHNIIFLKLLYSSKAPWWESV